MRILLVNINKKEFKNKVAPLGLCSISTYLKKYTNHEIKLFDQNVDDIRKNILQYNPNVICVSSTTANFDEAILFIDFCRLHISEAQIIIGGVHISLMPEDLPHGTIGVIGEGEQTVLELIESNYDIKTPGICYRINDVMYKSQLRIPIKSLDVIPIPDRTILNKKYYFSHSSIIPFHSGISGHLLTSRGCPYNCAFCSTKAFWGNPRMFSVDRVIDEIEDLVNNYNVKLIHIFDDLFLLNKKRFFEIVDKIEKKGINKKVKFMCLIRSDNLNDSIMVSLKRMNVVCVGIGMESGSNTILKYLKQNTTTIKDNLNAINLCESYEIVCMGSFMICNLNETNEQIYKTLNFIKAQRNNKYFVPLPYVTIPLPGTKLWTDTKDKNQTDICMDIPKTFNDTIKSEYLCDINKTQLYNIFQEFILESELQNRKNTKLFSTSIINSAIKNPIKAIKILSKRWNFERFNK